MHQPAPLPGRRAAAERPRHGAPVLSAAGWLDGFFEEFYRRHPVDATFIGIHRHDGELPDHSEAGAGDALAAARALLDSAPPRSAAASSVEALDLRLARGVLELRTWELPSTHGPRGNPALHTGEAVFGVLSPFLSSHAPLAERAGAAIERLRRVPSFLDTARDAVRTAPAAWTRRAIDECEGALRFLAGGIDALGVARAARVRRAADVAAAAFAAHREHLVTKLLPAATDGTGAGAEALALHLREAHFIADDAADIERRGLEGLDEARARLEEAARGLGATGPADALARLTGIHPPPDRYYARYAEVWEAMRAAAVEADLLTWPDAPIRYVPRPAWVREAAPHLYFLAYRSPPAFGRPPVHEAFVTPIGADLPADELRRRLEANNDAVIKLNHVIHHGGIGHHVQNWHAARAASRIGRVAAVDGPARIAMACGGTMAEGWACYATDLMSEIGALTELERCSELATRARMCARAVVDIRLHEGRMTLDEAIAFYREEARMTAAAATAEAVKNSMFPGAALMYMVGTDDIHHLRAEVSAARGPAFRARDFHDALLRLGSIPVRLAGRLLLDEAAPAAKRS